MEAHIVSEVVRIPCCLVHKIHVDKCLDMAIFRIMLWVACCVGGQRAALWCYCMSRCSKELRHQMF